MGTVLPKPILSRVVDRVGSSDVAAACCCINGHRTSMEDAHCMEIENDYMLFGVFDGHSNSKCSEFIAENLPQYIKKEGLPLSDEKLVEICLELDAKFLESVGEGGTTGTFCIIGKKEGANYPVTICNVGDSRILVLSDGKLKFATADHKPQNPTERSRIERCGGVVRMGRVDGDLAVSRAFGDGAFKRNESGDQTNQRVIAVPDISRHTLKEGDTLVLACDGVFEGTFSNEDVISYVHSMMPPVSGDHGVTAARVCERAVKLGSKDNISCMIVHLGDGTNMVNEHGKSSFVPGPPFPKNHDGSKQAYTHMAQLGNSNLPDALKDRYRIYSAYKNREVNKLPPIERVGLEAGDDTDMTAEAQFWGNGPKDNNDVAFFVAIAEGRV